MSDYDELINKTYFAIPKKLEKYIEFVPENTGIIIVEEKETSEHYQKLYNYDRTYYVCTVLKIAPFKHKNKWTNEQILKLTQLGTMRILGLKEKIQQLKDKIKKESNGKR